MRAVITLVDPQLREEALRTSFRFSCTDCQHFEPATRGCSFGFPTEEHRQASLHLGAELNFCKSFELG